MNRPDKAGEPSMEEILASIRQIIADEPSPDPSEPAIEANPLVPSHGSKPSETRVPLADRLTDVLKNGSLPPTSPLGSKRPLSYDQDLADMFEEEEPANGSSVSAPKPDIRVPAALSHPMSAKPFVPSAVAPSTDDDAQDLKGADATPAMGADSTVASGPHLAPSEAPSAPVVPLASPVGTEKPADAAPPATFGFPPLRKASFYPPQPKAPVVPRPASAGFLPSHPIHPAPDESSSSSTAVPADDAPLASVGGFGSSGVSGNAGAAGGGFAPDPLRSPLQASVSDAPPAPAVSQYSETPFAASAPPSRASAPASPTPGAPAAPQLGSAAADTPFRGPVEPRPYADPFAQSVRPGHAHSAPQFNAEPRMSPDAAHQALDALAQGLAASAAASSMPAEAVSPAIPLTPVFETEEPVPRAAHPSVSTLPATLPSQGSVPVNRTLEDAVADMLRPMLQQWVAENMPRIIERALRTEVAQTVKPGNKPPGI